jgi:hypothetical protein
MNIVSNSYFLRNLRNLDFFELDLGKSKKEIGKDTFRKIDPFVLQYKKNYESDINKFGKIGNKVFFYEDLKIENNKYIIFNNDDIYEITYADEDLLDLKQYLLDVLMKIDNFDNDEKQLEKNNDKYINEIGENDYWVAKDDKNNGKKYIINQSLSKEDYRKEIEKKFFNK